MINRPRQFKLSIVVPSYNEEQCIPQLVKELIPVVESISPDYEVIFVDDGSRDRSFDILQEINLTNPRVHGIQLSRNMGHQIALACGLNAAKGDVVISMDADLQHPPSVLPRLIEKWREGFDVVKTRRNRAQKIGFFEGLYSKTFYKIFNAITDIELEPDSADFRLLDRKALNALNEMPEQLKFYRGMISYIGFRQCVVSFDCPPRFAGARSYTLRKSLRLAANGIFSFSNAGLKVPLYFGTAVLMFVAVYLAITLVLLASGKSHLVSGWASIISVLLLSLGLQMITTGIFGLYIGKIYSEIKQRPLYFVDRTTIGDK